LKAAGRDLADDGFRHSPLLRQGKPMISKTQGD
jgi:hypothetical protein